MNIIKTIWTLPSILNSYNERMNSLADLARKNEDSLVDLLDKVESMEGDYDEYQDLNTRVDDLEERFNNFEECDLSDFIDRIRDIERYDLEEMENRIENVENILDDKLDVNNDDLGNLKNDMDDVSERLEKLELAMVWQGRDFE